MVEVLRPNLPLVPLFGLLLLSPQANAAEVKHTFDLSGDGPAAGMLVISSYEPNPAKLSPGHAWVAVVSYPGVTPKMHAHYGWYPAPSGKKQAVECLTDCPGYLAEEVQKQLKSKPSATFRSAQTLTLLLTAAELKAAKAEVDRWKAGDKLEVKATGDAADRYSLIARNCVTFSRSVLNATLRGRDIEMPATLATVRGGNDLIIPPKFVKNAAGFLRKRAVGREIKLE